MIISTKGRYALKLMMYLAKKNSAEFVPLKFISAQQNIPLKYLESITTILSKKKLVEATSGKGGGYRLSRSPETYSVGEILRAVEESIETLSWVCIVGAAPFAALGFFKYHGMTAEKVLFAYIKSEVLMPKELKFVSTNYYDSMERGDEIVRSHRNDKKEKRTR